MTKAQVLRNIRSSVGTVRRVAIRQKIVDLQSERAPTSQAGSGPGAKMIQSDTKDNPLKYLLSDSDDEESHIGVIRTCYRVSVC